MAKKKASGIKKFVVIGLVLIGCELLYLSFRMGFSGQKSLNVKDAIENVSNRKRDISAGRREQLKIQLAIADFMAANHGKLPVRLQELVPKYFDVVPIDPETSEPFQYRVAGDKYFLGNDGTSSPGLTNASVTTGGKSITQEEQTALIASLTEQTETFVYDPTGKRDPFRAFDFAPKPADGAGGTPLEKYALGQLKLTAVLEGFEEPAAIVEDATGRGYTVKRGTKIGTAGGEIIEIKPDKILILESNIDFTGERKDRTVEMLLRTKDQEERR